jgi:hypothetical protein
MVTASDRPAEQTRRSMHIILGWSSNVTRNDMAALGEGFATVSR